MSTYENTPESKKKVQPVNVTIPLGGQPVHVQSVPNVGVVPVTQGVKTVQAPGVGAPGVVGASQPQPFNVFAPGGPKIMGKFESMPDTMPGQARSSAPSAEVPVTRHYVGQSGPDTMPGKTANDAMGMASWDPVSKDRPHPQYNNYDKVPNRANGDIQSQPAGEIEGVPNQRYEGPYRPSEDNGQPHYMSNWDRLAQRMKDESAWNDMYSGAENKVKPKKSTLDAWLDEEMSPEGKKPEKEVPEYKDDKTKRDGGFFGWLKNALGDPRKSGETDEEYDKRITQNRKRMAVLADALRHMGNLVNVGKGAPSQTFNNPSQQMEAEYQQRKAQRLAEGKQKADEQYKAANLQLKQDAAKANEAYRALSLQFKSNADKRAAEKADADAKQRDLTNKRNADNDKFNHDMKNKEFEHKQKQDEISNSFKASNLAISQGRLSLAEKKEAREAAGGGSGGGSFTNIATPKGQMHRKKALDSVEKKQVWQKMRELGLITPAKQKKYEYAMTPQEQTAIMNEAIAYAARDSRKVNDKFREYLKAHHGYTDLTTTQTPAAKKADTGKGKGKGKYSSLR